MIERLYNTFQPEHYKLHLNLDAANAEFSGAVEITGVLKADSESVKLHSKELKITAVSVNGQATTDFKEEADDILSITPVKPVSGKAVIVVEFRGKISDAMHGIYPCYFEKDGVKKRLLATQFESHHAREAFPCVDEPAAKATFDVSLVTDENEAVLCNMPAKNQTVEAGRLTTEFETTPKMSTYLLAFVTGEMVMKEAKTKDGVIVRSWASAAQDPNWLDYSVEETVKLIEFYNEYFGVSYPLPKCDQVALPDFESGAMENWGLITYRETVFLTDPKNSSLGTKQYISLVVAHELSHQWFGNLVTMQWWDDLWLNESFANMTEYLAVDELHPEWQIWEEFVAQDALSATNRDVYSDVQAVRVAVNNPEEIYTLFDPSIVYAKGGKLLKMLHDLLGDDAWRKGLKDYFENNAYSNTKRDDLWSALSTYTELDLSTLMNGWIEHPGQPFVTVTQDGKRVALSQQRLLLDGSTDNSTIWEVPLLSPSLPLTFKSQREQLEAENDEWVRLNSSGVGHYITNYAEPAHKTFVTKALSDASVESAWKIARLNELSMLAKHGDNSLSEALDAVVASKNESRAMIWSLIAGIIGNARMLTEGDESAEATLQKLAGTLSEENYKKLGWNYTSVDDSNIVHLRTLTLGLQIASEAETVIEAALEQFRTASDPEGLPAESRSIILGTVSKFGTEAEFAQLVSAYKSTQNAEYKVDLCAALASTKDAARIQQLLKMVLDSNTVRSQDVRHWFVYLLRNKYGRTFTWNWLQENWPWIMETFGGSKSYDDFARYSASFLSTAQQKAEYEAFFADKMEDPSLKRTIAIGLQEISARVAWRERDQASVTNWLKKYSAKKL